MKTYIICLFIIATLLGACEHSSKKLPANGSATPPHRAEQGHDQDAHHNHDAHHEGHPDDHALLERDGHSTLEDQQRGPNVHAGEIIFTQRQAEVAGLTLETVSATTFQQVIKVSGQLQAALGDQASVVATTNGIVSFSNPSLADGSAVKAGETLLLISARNLLEGDPSVKARITYEASLKEYQRAVELLKDTIISEKEFARVRLLYQTAKTAYDALAANLGANGVRVTAPIGGYVKSRLVGQGEYVSIGQAIVTLSRNKRVQLRAEVSERYFNFLPNIRSAHFRMAYDSRVYKMTDLNGRLVSYGKATGQQSSYLPVTFEFDHVGDILPGSFAEVYLLSDPMDKVISVPVSALTEEQGLYFVYLQVDQEGYKKQEVLLGQDNGERVQVLSGLREGDHVVVKGVYQVKLAATSSVIPEGHAH